MSYLPHQIDKSAQLLRLLAEYHIAYLFGQVRSGKTRTVIKTAVDYGAVRPLVLTKKNAIAGWKSELEATGHHHFTVTNYEQAKKIDPKNHDLIIIDEAHNLGKVGKPTQRYKTIKRIAWHRPTIFLTGTPLPETPLRIYYQLSVCGYSPFSTFKNFYDFFRYYGIPSPIRINGRMVEQYNKSKPELLHDVEPIMVRMSQEDAGIRAKAEDKVHKVILLPSTKDLIKQITEDQVVEIRGKVYSFESDMAVRTAIHQAEAGAILLEEEIVELPNTEIIDYIRDTFGDSSDVAVMCHFRSTRQKIARHLPNVHTFSSDAHAEGVSLAGYKHFVIANTGYSGAKHIQRRDRATNINKTEAGVANHIVTDYGVSRFVYAQVSKKLDFNITHFRRLF